MERNMLSKDINVLLEFAESNLIRRAKSMSNDPGYGRPE
jgi:hypothetical protein